MRCKGTVVAFLQVLENVEAFVFIICNICVNEHPMYTSSEKMSVKEKKQELAFNIFN